MYPYQRKAFTMLELTFVIVIIGILSAVAIPKFATTRNDTVITKAKNTVAAVRNAIATERQKRILRGNFTKIFELSSNANLNKDIFDGFDGDTNNSVLAYPLHSCTTRTSQGCWKVKTAGAVGTSAIYTYMMPMSGSVDFTLNNNKFDCPSTNTNCVLLTR